MAGCHAFASGIPEADGKVSRLRSTGLLDGRRDTLPYAATAIVSLVLDSRYFVFRNKRNNVLQET